MSIGSINCSHTINFTPSAGDYGSNSNQQQIPIEVITETIGGNLTSICNEYHLLLAEDQRIYIQVKSTNAIAFTFIACAFLLFFYSCCWFNRFYWFKICGDDSENGGDREPTLLDIATRSSTTTSVTGISTAATYRNRGCLRSNRNYRRYPMTTLATIDGFCAINIDQTHSPEMPELGRRQDMDLESLPSYTICSGLPTYDDALDQFRKYGIILQPPSVIKIFEENKDKDKDKDKSEKSPTGLASPGSGINDDNISVTSTCTCGGGGGNGSLANVANVGYSAEGIPNMIELNPEHLQMLSQKRLSLQIALNNGLNPSIPPSARGSRVNLFREVSRNNLLRTHEIPTIHRSASQHSLFQNQLLAQRFNTQHRGSLH